MGERSDNNGKICSSVNSFCTDTVERHTTWDGYIGLMYPSDYGYAVGGSVRNECLAKSMYNWNESTPNCKGNDWLLPTSYEWTITVAPFSTNASSAFEIYDKLTFDYINNGRAARPVAYLKSSVKIKESSASDYGSESNPFISL